MKEKYKITKYPSQNKKIETFMDEDTFVTKHYYDAKDAYVKEMIKLKDGIKEVKHFTQEGVLSKLEHFVEDIRHGQETKYIISKANRSIKSTKIYDNGKLHGESITYNQNDEIIKHEVYALGKLVLKYLREDTQSQNISDVEIISKDSIVNLPAIEHEKLQSYLKDK